MITLINRVKVPFWRQIDNLLNRNIFEFFLIHKQYQLKAFYLIMMKQYMQYVRYILNIYNMMFFTLQIDKTIYKNKFVPSYVFSSDIQFLLRIKNGK
jgi:hypothetical protein